MLLMYGLAECNSFEIRRLYADRFFNRHFSDKKTFHQKLHECIRDTSLFKKRLLDSSIRTVTVSSIS